MKKFLFIMIAVTMLLGVSGCSAIFSNTYQSEQDFQGNEKIELDENVQVVQNYSELRRLVFGMMNNHVESTELVFSGYTGNVVSDIASVCNAVTTESSYGAYCVEYVSYDLRQIVSSYEAKISISYLYTQEELQILQTTSNLEGFGEMLASAMENEDPKLVVRVNNGTSDVETIEGLMEQTVRDHPLSISYIPKFQVKIYDGNSSQKIYDVAIRYDESIDNAQRLQEINSAVQRAVDSIETSQAAKQVVIVSDLLRELCVYDPNAGETVYDSLIAYNANSQGIACAFKAFCDRLGIECTVVSGRMDKQEHYWNIVKIDDEYYHVDVPLYSEIGGENSLFLKDTEKQVNCWWNQSAYPECDGVLSYTSVILSE